MKDENELHPARRDHCRAWRHLGLPAQVELKVTREPVCGGEINPMQCGQFVGILCTLVPRDVGRETG